MSGLLKRFKTKRICFFIVLTFLLSLVGCGSKNVSEDKPNSGSSATSEKYYKRVSIELPEGEKAKYISNSSQGGLNVVTINDNGDNTLWHMSNDDKFEKLLDVNSLFEIKDESKLNAFVSPDKELIVESVQYSPKVEKHFYYVDATGNKIELSIPMGELEEDIDNTGNGICLVRFIDGYIYIIDWNSDIYEVKKETNTVEKVFSCAKDSFISSFYVHDRTMIMQKNMEWNFQQLESQGDKKIDEEKLNAFLEEVKQINSNIELSSDEDTIWALSGDKIGRYNKESGQYNITKAIGFREGESIDSIAVDNGVLYAVLSKVDSDEITFCKYVDEVAEDVTSDNGGDNKLRIWALNPTIAYDACVRIFTDMYPNVEVEIEFGMNYDDNGITENDAVKNLNTMLMAGDGPDIIYMDGLNYRDYIESGELYDLTEFVDGLKASGEYFNNILDTYSQDGKTYIVPRSELVIGKVGTKEGIKASEDMSSFLEYIQSHNSKHSIIQEDLVSEYIMDMYYRDIKNDILSGNIDKSKLEEYFDNSKRLLELEGDTRIDLHPTRLFLPTNYSYIYDGSYEFIIGSRRMIGDDEFSYDVMAKQLDGINDFPASDYSNRYFVKDCLAISNSSKNKDLAIKYIEASLSEECQCEMNGTFGFQVNKNAFKKYNKEQYKFNFIDIDENSTSTDAVNGIDLEAFERKLSETSEKIEDLNKPMHVDMSLDYLIVFEEMNSYIHGDKSKEEAVNSLIEKLDIYMSE